MRNVINLVLVAFIGMMVFICAKSILGPINFDKQKGARDKKVIARLMDIRTIQSEYRKIKGVYTNNFDTLITFVKNGKIPFMLKEGELTDDQRENGMTEKKAIAIIERAKKTGNYRTVKKEGLEKFKREITYVNVMDTLFKGKDFTPDSLRYVPFTNGSTFEMSTVVDTTKSGATLPLFEARTLYSVYLKGLDKQEVYNLIDFAKKLDKYPGLKVGDIESPNNNAGNWE